MDLDAATTAAAISEAHREVLDRECRLFRLAAHWADLHGPTPESDRATGPGPGRAVRLGGPGTPEMVEFAAEELGARMETTARAAESLIADALDLRHRLPRLWALVGVGGVRVWRVRKVAQATRHLSVEAAGLVDAAVAGSVAVLPWARFENVLDAQIIAADPRVADEQTRLWEADRFVRAGRARHGLKTIVARAHAGDVAVYLATVNRIAEILATRGDTETADVRRSKAVGILAQPALALELLWEHREDQPAPDLPDEPTTEPAEASGAQLRIIPPPLDPGLVKPRVVLYVHVASEAVSAPETGGVVRFEDVGPVTLDQVRRFLAGTSCDIRVQPVIDLHEDTPVDGYQTPRRMREQQLLRSPASCFPFSPATTRRMDLDHTVAYLAPSRGGPPGQTRIGNLGPLTRHEHRLKTHSRWRVRQPEPDSYVWRSPYGAHYLTTRAGTLALGDGEFGRAVWRTACTADQPARPTDYHWRVGPAVELALATG